jgi:hypothetical protein
VTRRAPRARLRSPRCPVHEECRKLFSPVAKCRFADIESDTLFTQGFDNQVNVRVALVRVQSHRITMLKRESIHGERPHRGLELVSRGALWT